MEYVYKLLENEIDSLLKEIACCKEIEVKAELIGNKNLLEHSLKLLKKCEENDVRAGSIFTKLPAKLCDTPSCDYRIIEDGETDDQKYWYEVKIEGKKIENVRLHEGDIVIEL